MADFRKLEEIKRAYYQSVLGVTYDSLYDLEKAYFNELGFDGDIIADLERAYLQSVLGSTVSELSTLWGEYYDNKGIGGGRLAERELMFYRDSGFGVIISPPVIFSVDGDESSPASGILPTPLLMIHNVLVDDTITIYSGSTPVGTVVAEDVTQGLATSGLTVGVNTLTAKITRDGTTSRASNSFVFNLLPLTPTISTVNGQATSPVTDNVAIATVDVSGVVSGDEVKLYNGVTLVDTLTASDITAEFVVNDLAEAEYVFTVTTKRNDLTSASSEAFSYTYTAVVVPAPVLLVNFNGTDGVTSYAAETGQTVTFTGNAQLDTADKKFGSASLLLDGTGDSVSVPNSSDWDFGSGDFTIDFWVKFSGSVGTGFLFSQYTDDSNRLLCYTNGTGLDVKLIKTGSSGGVVGSLSIATTGFDTTNWFHCAYVRNGNRYDFYVNGVSLANTTDTDTWANLTGAFFIGAYYDASTATAGWFDSFRITKGTALWTTDFSGSLPSEPTAPAPPSLPTLDQSYEGGTGTIYHDASGVTKLAVSFTPTHSGDLNKFGIYLKIGGGSPTGNTSLELFTDNSGVPDVSLGVIGTIDESSVTGSWDWYYAIASTSIPITSSSTYWVVISKTHDASSYVHVGAVVDATNNVLSFTGSWAWFGGATPIMTDFRQYYI
jgi:hypothetical protein